MKDGDTGMGTGTLFLGRNRVTRVGAGTGDIQTDMGTPYRNGAVSSVCRATSACWGIDGQGWGQTRIVTVSSCPLVPRTTCTRWGRAAQHRSSAMPVWGRPRPSGTPASA